MEWKETTFEEDYNDAVASIGATSLYGRLPCKEKKYMTAAEMGKLLGLKKTDRYWLLHKNYFEWESYRQMQIGELEQNEKIMQLYSRIKNQTDRCRSIWRKKWNVIGDNEIGLGGILSLFSV